MAYTNKNIRFTPGKYSRFYEHIVSEYNQERAAHQEENEEKEKDRLEYLNDMQSYAEDWDRRIEAEAKINGFIEMGVLDLVKDKIINGDDEYLKYELASRGMYFHEILEASTDETEKFIIKQRSALAGYHLDELHNDPDPEIRYDCLLGDSDEQYIDEFCNDTNEDIRYDAQYFKNTDRCTDAIEFINK